MRFSTESYTIRVPVVRSIDPDNAIGKMQAIDGDNDVLRSYDMAGP